MERLKERLTLARNALKSFEELVVIGSPSKVERDATIQRFEYTFEAVYKAAGRFLLVIDGIDVGSPKAIVRSSREVGVFEDDQAVIALEMVDDRNLTVHTYNEALAEQIFSNLPLYAQLLAHWLKAMEAKVRQLP